MPIIVEVIDPSPYSIRTSDSISAFLLKKGHPPCYFHGRKTSADGLLFPERLEEPSKDTNMEKMRIGAEKRPPKT
jgi:hypothetical protein